VTIHAFLSLEATELLEFLAFAATLSPCTDSIAAHSFRSGGCLQSL
jgi:hypothetical protein